MLLAEIDARLVVETRLLKEATEERDRELAQIRVDYFLEMRHRASAA